MVSSLDRSFSKPPARINPSQRHFSRPLQLGVQTQSAWPQAEDQNLRFAGQSLESPAPSSTLREKAWHAFKEGAWKSYRLLEDAINSLVQVSCRLALMSTFVFRKMPQFMYDFIERQTFYSPVKSCSLELLEDDHLADKIIKYQVPLKNGGGKRIDISAWHIPAQEGQPTVVFSHGRQSNISHLKHYLKAFSDQGYGMLAYDYPGFGSSTGKVSLENCYKSSLEVCQFLRDRIKIPISDQILVGYSLGTHITSHMAATISQNANNAFGGQAPKGVVLINSFPRLSDGVHFQKQRIAEDKLSLLPNKLALKILDYFFDPRKMRQDLDTESNLAQTQNLPTLVISGDADRELNYQDAQEMTQRLKNKGHRKIQFEVMRDVPHCLKEKECRQLVTRVSQHLSNWV